MTEAECTERAEALELAVVELRRLTSAVGSLMSERATLRAQLAHVEGENARLRAFAESVALYADYWDDDEPPAEILGRVEARARETLRAALEATPPADTVAVPRATLQSWLDGCWCDDRDGNSNPPHNVGCERCQQLAALLEAGT